MVQATSRFRIKASPSGNRTRRETRELSCTANGDDSVNSFTGGRQLTQLRSRAVCFPSYVMLPGMKQRIMARPLT
jgi:hypothetical protein